MYQANVSYQMMRPGKTAEKDEETVGADDHMLHKC